MDRPGRLLGLNVGLAGFVVGLLAVSAPLKHAFTPILGLSLLLGMLVLSLRLGQTRSGQVAATG